MSVEHITTEAISLKVTDEETRKLAGRIIEQFTRLNKGMAKILYRARTQAALRAGMGACAKGR